MASHSPTPVAGSTSASSPVAPANRNAGAKAVPITRYAAGTRVRVTQQVPRLTGVMVTTVEGTVVRYGQQKTGSWFAHAQDDKLWLDRLELKKADGELVVLNLDQYSRVEIPGEEGPILATGRNLTAPPAIPVGLPSDLLRRRPDVRQAERSLAAATARVGVQVANLFPSISLTAQYGVQAGNALNLTQAAASFYTLGPQIKWGLLNYPATKANIRTYEARRDQQYLTYRKTVLTAFQDVENALVAYHNEHARHASLEEEVKQQEKAARIAMTRYTQGLSNFLDVLDTQRSLYTAQDALVQSRAALAIDLIALYKALGGGWEHNDLVDQTVQWANLESDSRSTRAPAARGTSVTN